MVMHDRTSEWGCVCVCVSLYFTIACCSHFCGPKTFCSEEHSSIMRRFFRILFLSATLTECCKQYANTVYSVHKIGKLWFFCVLFLSHWWCGNFYSLSDFIDQMERDVAQWKKTSHRNCSHWAHRILYNIHSGQCWAKCQQVLRSITDALRL